MLFIKNRTLPICFNVFLISFFLLLNSRQAIATVLNLNYTFSTATAGTTVTVTWTTDNPLDMVNISLVQISIFTAVQGLISQPNSGSASFFISNVHPAGQYQFYIETVDRSFWHYGPLFDLLPANACCQNQAAFLAAAQQGFNVLEQKCGIALTPKALSDCQQTTYTWGDGNSTGPLTGNATANHLYIHPGFYDLCAKVQEINEMGVTCFMYDTCWQVCVTCDTCKMPTLQDMWVKSPATTRYDGGNNSYAQIYADAIGDFYTIGTYTGVFDNGPDPDFANNGDMDCVIAKYKNDGTLVPNYTFGIGGTNREVGAVIAPHPTGGFYVGGISWSPSINLPSPGGGSGIILTNTSIQHIFLACYATDRTLLWGFGMSGANNTQINDIETDASGNLYITGLADAALNYNPLGTPAILPANGHAYIAKYDPNGLLIWVRLFNAPYGLNLTLDVANQVYICGEFFGTPMLSGHPVPGAGFPAMGLFTTATGSGTPFVAKFNSNGDFQWAFALQSASKNSSGANYGIDANNNGLYVGGSVSAGIPIDFNPRGTPNLQTLSSNQANFIARYNTATGLLEKFALNGADKGLLNVTTGQDGKVYSGGLAGATQGPRGLYVNIFDKDLALLKSLRPGNLGSTAEVTWAVAPDPFGDFAISGVFRESPFDADPQANDGPEFTFSDGLPHLLIGKYTCDCPGSAPTICSPCDSISANFINKTKGKTCCGGLRLNNLLANTFSGIQINIVSGGTLPILNVNPQTGWQITNFIDGQSVNLEPTGGGPIPIGFSNTAFICFENLSAAEQVVEIKYFSLKDSVLCRDTLRFQCDYCVKFSQDSVTCKGFDKRELTFCVSVPLTQDWHVNSLILASPVSGITFNPSAFPMPNIAPGATSCTYTTTINIATGTVLPDTLCIKLTAHQMDITQGKPPGECCMTEACVPMPDCLCDSTWATAQSIGFKGDTCCWKFSLTNPNGVFNSINTEIVTPGVVFSTLGGAPGWMLDFNSVTDVNWLPQTPQGSFIQNGYALPAVCFGEASPGSFVSPFEVAFTWTTPEGISCDTTLELECPWMEMGLSDCVILDSVRFKCPPASGLPFQLTVEVINNSFAPAFHAEKVTFVPLSPAGLNISPAMTNVNIPNGSSTNVTVDITGPIPTGSLLCFMAILHDLDVQGNELNCCSSDTFCYQMPFCPFFNMNDPVMLFPNPTRNYFGIYLSENAPADSRIRLLDVSGRVVLEQPIEVGAVSHLISLETCPSGLYFVEFLEKQKRIWFNRVVRQ